MWSSRASGRGRANSMTSLSKCTDEEGGPKAPLPGHKHSPLPWTVDEDTIRDARGELVTIVSGTGSFVNDQADAALIVRAVNLLSVGHALILPLEAP